MNDKTIQIIEEWANGREYLEVDTSDVLKGGGVRIWALPPEPEEDAEAAISIQETQNGQDRYTLEVLDHHGAPSERTNHLQGKRVQVKRKGLDRALTEILHSI